MSEVISAPQAKKFSPAALKWAFSDQNFFADADGLLTVKNHGGGLRGGQKSGFFADVILGRSLRLLSRITCSAWGEGGPGRRPENSHVASTVNFFCQNLVI